MEKTFSLCGREAKQKETQQGSGSHNHLQGLIPNDQTSFNQTSTLKGSVTSKNTQLGLKPLTHRPLGDIQDPTQSIILTEQPRWTNKRIVHAPPLFSAQLLGTLRGKLFCRQQLLLLQLIKTESPRAAKTAGSELEEICKWKAFGNVGILGEKVGQNAVIAQYDCWQDHVWKAIPISEFLVMQLVGSEQTTQAVALYLAADISMPEIFGLCLNQKNVERHSVPSLRSLSQ